MEWTHQGPRRVPGAPLGRATCPPGCLVAPLGAPFGLYLAPSEETPNIDLLFSKLLFVPPPPPFQDRGCQEKLPRHPAGRRNHFWETLHRHGRLPDVP